MTLRGPSLVGKASAGRPVFTPPSTVLGTRVADLNAQIAGGGSRWISLSTTNFGSVINVGGSTGNMLPYTTTGVWNPINSRVELLGNDHGWPNGLRHVQYRESDNTWAHVGHADTPSHGYDHTEVDRTTGDLYHRSYHYGSGGGVRRLPFGGAWEDWSTIPYHMQVSIGVALWSGSHDSSFGARGALIFFDGDFGTLAGKSITSPSTNYNFGTVSVTTGYDTVAAYNPTSNLCVFGGGAEQPRQAWRMNSAGTITAMPLAPSNCGIGTYRGILVEDPNSGNFLVFGGSAKRIFSLDPTGSGTWTDHSGSNYLPPSIVNNPGSDGGECVGIVLREHGVIMFVSTRGGAGSGNVHLYKHG